MGKRKNADANVQVEKAVETVAEPAKAPVIEAAVAAVAAVSSKMVSFKDVSMSFLMNGIEGVEALAKSLGKPISEEVLRAAINGMKGVNTLALQEYTDALHGEKSAPGQRGRAAPKLGDVKSYKTQKLDKGHAFLHLPLGPLTDDKGVQVNVTYEAGRIVITL